MEIELKQAHVGNPGREWEETEDAGSRPQSSHASLLFPLSSAKRKDPSRATVLLSSAEPIGGQM